MAAPLSTALRAAVRLAATNRCGYCLTSQAYIPWPLEIDHIIPRARGGSDAEDNLWLSCRACNLFKGQQTLTPALRRGGSCANICLENVSFRVATKSPLVRP